ncbi:MAG: 3-deoxy-7-phosphoheptulonate synthase [Chloroherpetonaceae bacterium]|nr:3-deoxy-7-phosphoheptulonate synthase [Chthonomonadaceae bacterium]MDW8207092.1 3-deoxy-7-phosphoheptulonate synthase [Chloroherpetonaceae bacterium]
MIVVMAPHATQEQIRDVERRIQEWGYGAHPIYGAERTVIGAVGVPEADKARYMESLEALPYVERVIAILRPYKFASREFHPDGTVVDVRGVPVGGREVVLMAGPCTVETYEQTYASAKACRAAGASILRGGAYKPSTSPYSFQGLGVEGLRILRDIADCFQMRVITEVMDVRNVDLVAQYADILQIGTRNMQNYDLLREVGRSRTPVLIKRGMWARIEEWLQAAEYVLLGGNPNVILCERGIRTFETYTRNTLDLSAVPAVKELSHLPVIVDPSQGTGKRSLVTAMARAAVAAGADGLLVEVHPHPEEALKDGAQSLTCSQFEQLVAEIRPIVAAVGRTLHAPDAG